MDQLLERYLNDHHAAACGAIKLVGALSERQEEEMEQIFYENLKSIIEDDRKLLESLLEKASMEKSLTLQVAGQLAESASRLKLLWEGLEPGGLGMFEALEVLTLGLQGKRLLWVMLGELAPYFPEWRGVDFAALELAAIQQRDEVEKRRIEHGYDALLDSKRRAARN